MWDHAQESFTLTAALATATEELKLYASVAILTQHPAIIARMAATIDDISDGRFGVNIVTGWNRQEYAQMGAWPGDEYFGARYDYASEYVTILRELWEHGASDFKGKYFQLDDCRMSPRPANHIDVVCAGSSDRGLAFTSQFGDYAFNMGGGGIEGLAEANRKVMDAADRAGRTVGTYHSYQVILADTDEEAEAKVRAYREAADVEAIAYMAGQAEFDINGATSARINELRDGAFMSTEVIAGSPDTVAAKFDEIAAIEGTTGVMLCFDDYLEGIERMGQDVMPRMQTFSTVS
jgi:pyrimidine oxygenase